MMLHFISFLIPYYTKSKVAFAVDWMKKQKFKLWEVSSSFGQAKVDKMQLNLQTAFGGEKYNLTGKRVYVLNTNENCTPTSSVSPIIKQMFLLSITQNLLKWSLLSHQMYLL